ncbi:8230_t:CDS:2 [Cetraspora pellucida]|uniref:8230_t:CDS:1 n=1 Tax=Cetraspora pellucida TaxID=1433469 RepID=A0ACA9L5X8_9GLOM|nr:8230_t:CDS:2 [Cetraspora pellucida]
MVPREEVEELEVGLQIYYLDSAEFTALFNLDNLIKILAHELGHAILTDTQPKTQEINGGHGKEHDKITKEIQSSERTNIPEGQLSQKEAKEETTPRNLYQKLQLIQSQIGQLEKTRENKFQKYFYAGEYDLLKVIKP